jgi:hypothetical protein
MQLVRHAAVPVAVVITIVAVIGGAGHAALGDTDPGAAVRYAVALVRLIADGAGAITVGALFFAGFLVPAQRSTVLGAGGYAALRTAERPRRCDARRQRRRLAGGPHDGVAAVLLVLGGPMTLALRALPAGHHGPREWITALPHCRLSRILTNPVVACVLMVGSYYGLNLSPLSAAALPLHWAHVLMNVHFLLTFCWTVIGVNFYRSVDLPLVGNLLADQRLGGGITWAPGELPMLVVVIALLVQWSRADNGAARRFDRHADSEDEPAACNAMLAKLAETRR